VKEPRCHAGIVEIAVAKLLNYRQYTIVPNVSWGLGLSHECDLLALDDQDRFTEVEIKVSLSDLKADFKKTHKHFSKFISRLVYALPARLYAKHADLIPKEFGVIVIEFTPAIYYHGVRVGNPQIDSTGAVIGNFKAKWERRVKHYKHAEKPSPATIRKFMSLGCMRIWDLKQHCARSEQRITDAKRKTGVMA